MPVKLIPIEPPGDIDPDDPLGLLASTSKASQELVEARIGRAGQVITNIVGALRWNPDLHPRNRLGQFIDTPDAPEAYRPPSVPEVPQVKIKGQMYGATVGMASPNKASGETVMPKTGPRYPADANADSSDRAKRAGEVIRPGQTVEYKGREWEVSHIANGHLILDESSGKKSKAEVLILGPQDMAPDGTVPGLKVGKPRNIKGGKGLKTGTIRIVSPYVEPATHDPMLKLPEESELTEDEWRQFGRVEQLHYIDLMDRFGSWKASGTASDYFVDAPVQGLIDQLLSEFDDEIVQIVRQANLEQKGASTTNTLSLTGWASTAAEQFEKREKAMELQQRLNDIIAWDLYNRLRAPDILSFHGDQNNEAVSWWKTLFAKDAMFSGLSQTFSAEFAREWAANRCIVTPLSIRHLTMATFVSNWFQGGWTAEREISIVSRMKADDRTLVISWNEIGPEARQWLMAETGTPRPGSLTETLRDHLDNGTDLPVVVAPDIQVSAPEFPPPPTVALEAMEEYGTIPEIRGEPYEPSELAKSNLPFKTLDEDGNPIPEIAGEAGLEPGDFMVGLKGTLYWLGPNPNPNTGFPLVYHKIIQDSDGSLSFSGETYGFENAGGNKYYFLKGNVPPIKPKEAPDFDPGAWAFAAEDPIRIADMPLGTKFKVNGKPYEKIEESGKVTTRILDLETGAEGTVNSKYKTVRLLPSGGIQGQTILEPVKGLTLSYEGKKHTITNVKKDGTISLKPSGGGKVIKITADDIALENLFDPSQWEIGEQTKLGNLKPGELFQGGQGQQTIKPYKVLDIEGNKVQWQNLDTGEKGSSTLKKTVRKLDPTTGSAGEAQVEDAPAPSGPSDATVAANAPDSWDDEAAAIDKMLDSETPEFHNADSLTFTASQIVPGVYIKTGGEYKQVSQTEKVNGMIQVTYLDGTVDTMDPDFEPEMKIPISKKDSDGDATPNVATKDLKVGDVVTEKGETKTVDFIEPGEMSGEVRITWDDGSISLWNPDFEPESVKSAGTSSVAPLEGYKSKWGSGGKYKHDFIADLDEGTVFQDKGGKQYMVVDSGSGLAPITITDGKQTFTVTDTSIRVRALPDAELLGPAGESEPESPEPPEVEPDATALPPIKADDIDALPEADDFLPYKSKWGSGGKYTHDKISEMPVGTVLKDKNGKLWKVQSNDLPKPVITDGEKNYQIDGNLRGRAMPGKELNAPAPPILEKPYGTGQPIPGLITPDPDTKLPVLSPTGVAALSLPSVDIGDLPQNTIVSLDGGESAYIVTGVEAAPGTALLLPVGNTTGGPIGVPKDTVPTHLAPGPATEVGPPKAVTQKDMVANTKTITELLAEGNGQSLYFQIGGLVYVAKQGDMMPTYWVVQDDGTEVLVTAPTWPKPDLVPDKVAVTPAPAPPKTPQQPEPQEPQPENILITNLDPGDEFPVEIDGLPVKYEVVAVGEANSWVKDSMTGEVLTLDNDDQPTPSTVAQVKATLSPQPEQAPAYPGGGGAAVAELQALTFDEVKELPVMPIKYYKSKWGSGGKYKHDFLNDLNPGDRFTPSGTTDEYILVKSVGGGVVLIYKPSDGTYGIADGKGRVRRV